MKTQFKIDAAQAQKRTLELVRMLVRCRDLLAKHTIDMEEADSADSDLYADTCDIASEVEILLSEVER